MCHKAGGGGCARCGCAGVWVGVWVVCGVQGVRGCAAYARGVRGVRCARCGGVRGVGVRGVRGAECARCAVCEVWGPLPQARQSLTRVGCGCHKAGGGVRE